jgi:hypothetical protein
MTAAQAGADAAARETFERRPCGMGSKGPRLFGWALVATGDPNEVLLIRRLIARPDQLAYFICHVPDPAKIRLPYLATIAGRRWPVEETFKTGKDVLGFDQSQARTHPGLHRPTDLGHIKLSVGEHRRLHALALAKAAGLLFATAEAFHLAWSRRRRRHQANARWHPYQRHLHLALDPT